MVFGPIGYIGKPVRLPVWKGGLELFILLINYLEEPG